MGIPRSLLRAVGLVTAMMLGPTLLLAAHRSAVRGAVEEAEVRWALEAGAALDAWEAERAADIAAFEADIARRERALDGAREMLRTITTQPPEVVYETDPDDRCPVPAVCAGRVLRDAARANRAIARALPGPERGAYEAAAARADNAADAAVAGYAELLNRVSLLTAMYGEAAIAAHGLQDYVTELQMAGVVDDRAKDEPTAPGG